MKVVVIGACGHIGSYLVPKLVKGGFKVVAISRGKSKPYINDPAWKMVEQVVLDRNKDEDFAYKVAKMNADIVVDLINFNIEDTKKMVTALKEIKISHYLYCSSIWAHGRAEFLPADPNSLKEPLDDYGVDKYQSELYLKEQYRKNGFPATIIMPGQISGPGWTIIVHGDDVAQMFYQAITHRNQALGESFHAVERESMTLYGYAKAMYRYFNQEPKIKFLSWEKWCKYVNDDELIDHTYYHIARSGEYSIENAQKLLEYSPKYTTLETVEQAVASYIERGIITL